MVKLRVWVAMLCVAVASCGGGDRPSGMALVDSAHTVQAVPKVMGAPRAVSQRPQAEAFRLDSTSLMDWAEQAYPQYFPSHRESQYFSPYVYRFYPETGAYLGVDGKVVRVLIPSLSTDILTVGAISDFLCLVFADRCTGAPLFAPAPMPPATTTSKDVLWLRTDSIFSEYLTSNQLIYWQTPDWQPQATGLNSISFGFGGTQLRFDPGHPIGPFVVRDEDATGSPTFKPGLNKLAGRGPFAGVLPGLEIWTPGRGCSPGISSYFLHELELDPSGKVLKFAADLSFDCAGGNHQLQGAVRFHSDVPSVLQRAFAVAGADIDVGEGRSIILDGSRSWSPAAPIFKATWTQLSGPALDLSDCTTLTCRSYSPVLPDGNAEAVLRLDVQTENGLTDSDTVRVRIASNADRKSLVEIWGAGFIVSPASDAADFSFGPASSHLYVKKLQGGGSIYQNQTAERLSLVVSGLAGNGAYSDFAVDLMNVKGSLLTPGTYFGQGSGYEAYQFPSIALTNVTGGAGCNQVGRMIIGDIDRDPSDYTHLRSLSAFVRVSCQTLGQTESQPTYARVLVNHVAQARPTARLNGTAIVMRGGTIELSAAASSGPRPLDTLVWRQIAGPPVATGLVVTPDGLRVSASVGTDAPAGSRMVFSVDAIDDTGEADTAVIVLTVH